MKLNNKYFILRHGEALSNVNDVVSSWPEKFENPLTEKGKKQSEEIAQEIISKQIDLIFSSDILRAKQTAEIVGEKLNLIPRYDESLREIDFGIFNSKKIEEFINYFGSTYERIKGRVPGGESYEDVLKRMGSFLKEVETDYAGKNILIISHQPPLFVFEGMLLGFSLEKSVEYFNGDNLLKNCEFREIK